MELTLDAVRKRYPTARIVAGCLRQYAVMVLGVPDSQWWECDTLLEVVARLDWVALQRMR